MSVLVFFTALFVWPSFFNVPAFHITGGTRAPTSQDFCHPASLPNLIKDTNKIVPVRWEFKGKLGVKSQS